MGLSAYVSGPMRGQPRFNWPTFGNVTRILYGDERFGHVVSPAEHDQVLFPDYASYPGYVDGDVVAWGEASGFDYHAAMRWDLQRVAETDAIVMLPGWEQSTGAKTERLAAEQTGSVVFLAWEVEVDYGLTGWKIEEDPVQRRMLAALEVPPVSAEAEPPSVLEEAQGLIFGERQGDYGHPYDDFSRTGRLWGAILGIPDVPPAQVGLCMVAVKISREVNRPKRDNRVDGAGYWGCVELVREREGV